jgi:hypothetical protein
MSKRLSEWVYNPVRVTLALPADVALHEIDWVREQLNPTPEERNRYLGKLHEQLNAKEQTAQ